MNSWKHRVKRKIEKGLSWEEEFEQFKLSLRTEEAKKWTKWGKDMREQNIGNHHCGSGGYRGKKPIWDKEDAK